MRDPIHCPLAVAAALLLSVGCASGTKSPAAGTKPAVGTAAAAQAAPAGKSAGKKVPLGKLIATAQAELATMQKIWDHDYSTGRALGGLNGQFQRSAFFSRIPSIPAMEALRAEIQRLASMHNLIVEKVGADVPDTRPPVPTVLKPGERWEPTDDELFATIRLEIDLQGPVEAAARFIDTVPTHLERLVVVTGDRARSGGVRLLAECWFERGAPMPKLDLPWLEVEQRLRAAGYDPDNPQLADNPQIARLSTIVDTGRRRMNDIKNTLAVASDFPRWFARARFFEAKQVAAGAVKGAELLGSIAGK